MKIKNLGEFIHAIRFTDKERLRVYGLMEDINGGYSLPPQVSIDFLDIGMGDAIVRPRSIKIDPDEKAPDAETPIPVLEQFENGATGNMRLKWIEEGEETPELDLQFYEAVLTPKEIVALTTVGDKLLYKKGASTSYFSKVFKNIIAQAEDEAFLTGNGVAKPIGVLNATCRVEVTRNTAGDIKEQDIYNMIGRFLPSSLNESTGVPVTWVASSTLLPKLLELGTTEKLLKLGSKRSTLAGLPIQFSGVTPELGNRGDLMLCDFRYYVIKNGAGPFFRASDSVTYSHFAKNISDIKLTWSVDGQNWLRDPLVIKGQQVSPFVVLN